MNWIVVIGVVALLLFVVFPEQTKGYLQKFNFGGGGNTSNSSVNSSLGFNFSSLLTATTTSTTTTSTTSPDWNLTILGRPSNDLGEFNCELNSDCSIYLDCFNCTCRRTDGVCYY